MRKRKILISDYDGTFFLDENDIKTNVKKVNEFRKENNLFVIATGNNFKDFQTVILKYKIKFDYLILDQGASIFDSRGKLLKYKYLDYNISKKIVSKIKQENKLYKLCSPYNEVETLEQKNITKIATTFSNLNEAKDFTNKINEEFGEYVNAYVMIFKDINIVEIISSETDKNEAIKYIINKAKIKKDNVYTIGNGYNDISMIENFNGYCMKGSVKELLKKCPNHIESVSCLIEKMIIKNN